MTSWSGDASLLATADRLLGSSHPRAAVALVTPQGSATAWRGVSEGADFEIGSISKAMTGMLYRDSIDRGRVTPTTVLAELLPLDGHGALERVTLEALASHRSGLPRLPPGMQPMRRSWRLWTRGENPYGDSLAELLEQCRGVRLGAGCGRYSNLGFQLLGHAVAAAEGTSYVELLQSRFGPGYWAPRTEDELRPSSLRGVSRRGRPREAWTGEAIAPAGGIRATIGAMRDLIERILDGSAPGLSALDPDTAFGPGVRIGAGWITIGRDGRSLTWHNGGTGGFRSWIGVDRASGTGAVILTACERSVDRAGFRLLGEPAPSS
ncbi:MAG: serine hydrolase domain-containing protein [Microcella sp.]|uniref:serine hydrolase domain-containing protein n=1 Tax=Microcella sp. TaxID=1913979 RepID=UPI002723E206|nr:serine hydrolase domain-containing protein [Microcella sp.]MDO8338302.1 serine hydrolase domain-containing protein [Microcella sp.]